MLVAELAWKERTVKAATQTAQIDKATQGYLISAQMITS